MAIEYDKFYTPEGLAEFCVERTLATFGNSISEFVEPSAGSGAFLPALKSTEIPTLAYDIKPEAEGIETADFLSLDLPYKAGRCVIGNPPFFYQHKIGLAFYKKACEIADFVAFILPISIYKGSPEFCAFDLVSSELLPEVEYSGVKVKCCLNLYQRPKSGRLNVKAVSVGNSKVWFKTFGRGEARNDRISEGYVLGFCSFGQVGKPSPSVGYFSQELYVYCADPELAEKIKAVSTFERLYSYARQFSVSTPRLTVTRYWDYLRETVPEVIEEVPTLEIFFV